MCCTRVGAAGQHGWHLSIVAALLQILPDADDESQVAAFDAAMLCLLPGAKERTLAQSEELYSKAGLVLDKVATPVPGSPSMQYLRKA